MPLIGDVAGGQRRGGSSWSGSVPSSRNQKSVSSTGPSGVGVPAGGVDACGPRMAVVGGSAPDGGTGGMAWVGRSTLLGGGIRVVGGTGG